MNKKLVFAFCLIFSVLLCVAPAFGAHITKFNGIAASTADQVNTVRIAVGQKGNVTVEFTNLYVLDGTNNTLVISFPNANISSFTYNATGDTANLTVTRNPTNITFKYGYTSTVNVTDIALTFDFANDLNATTGICDKVTVPQIVLTYVSDYITPRTLNNTTEVVYYMVYDPLQVYEATMGVINPENASITVKDNEMIFNLCKCEGNKLEIGVHVTRGVYNNTLVPIQEAKISLVMNDTYITSPLTISTVNCTEIGSVQESGQTILTYYDTNVSANKSIAVSASFWNTNGSIVDGIGYKYYIDPVGGIPVTVSKLYSLNVTEAAALGSAPSGPMWYAFWKYSFLGVPVLAWFGIIIAAVFIGLVAYRMEKGMSPIPKSVGAQAASVGLITYVFALATLKDWWHAAFEWVANNPLPSLVIFTLLFAFLTILKVHLWTTRR